MMNTKALFFLAAMTAATAAFAQSEADFTVERTRDGTGVVITKYTGKAAAVIIPAVIQGMPVKEIGKVDDYANGPFARTGITSVVIPGGVTRIGGGAFYECRMLANVSLQDGLTAIGRNAFFSCTSLRTITLPDSVTTLGGGSSAGEVFAYSGVTSVTLSKGLTAIEQGTFQGCMRLTSIVIPEGVTEIGANAFLDCAALASLTLPSTIKTIEGPAFQSCSALASITIPESVGAIDFTFNTAFMFCPKIPAAAQAVLKKLGYRGRF
jgi:hypothetical protein